VNPFHTNRRNLSRFTFVFLGLVISVFTWGLQYKLSLYDPPHATSHQIPEAKMLSRDEQKTSAASVLVTTTKGWAAIAQAALFFGVFALFLLSFDLLGKQIFSQKAREARRPWRVCCRPSLNAFFFRPPPART
jgi:hypothetical protein